MPYSLATNDAKLVGGPLVTGRAFGDFLIDSYEVLRAESQLHPRMMSVGLHCRVVGHPGRIGGLMAFMDHLAAWGDDVWICGRTELAAHWRRVQPYQGPKPGAGA